MVGDLPKPARCLALAAAVIIGLFATAEPAQAYVGPGMALGALGDPAGAGREYEQAAALQPSLAEAHYQLGLLNENFGRPQPALACFRRAMGAAPESTPSGTKLPFRSSGPP